MSNGQLQDVVLEYVTSWPKPGPTVQEVARDFDAVYPGSSFRVRLMLTQMLQLEWLDMDLDGRLSLRAKPELETIDEGIGYLVFCGKKVGPLSPAEFSALQNSVN